MNILCSTNGIIDIEHPGQGVLDIAQAGFSRISGNFSKLCSPAALEEYGVQRGRHRLSAQILEHPENIQAAIRTLQKKCVELKVSIDIAVAPYLSRNTKRTDLSELLVKLSEESICACGSVNCKYLVVRPLFSGIDDTEVWNRNREYYLRLAPLAQKNDVMILVENQCKDINGHLVRGICSDGITAAEWVDKLNEAVGEEQFGFCMNVGVCNLCGQNMYEFSTALGQRIKAVVLSDCDGESEDALLPFSGAHNGKSKTDWLNLIRGLRAIGYDGQLVVDLGDTASAFSPILRPPLLRLAKATADYFKWQIGIESLLKKYPSRVLFGAGNMCRNYMKCFGTQYPPQYTCDNDSGKWGTEFCGLIIKSPESLRDLPEDTAIFICNVYYREIEKQLREMGIHNPIEFFNDEYLPSFHFDRVEDIMERNTNGGSL